MTDYSKTTNFTAKDALASGDPNKVIKGSEYDTEYDNISTAVATKANKSAPATTNNLAMLSASGDLADSLVETDGAGNITANVTGNADTATTAAAWTTTRTIGMSGDISSDAVNIDGSGNITITNTDIDPTTVGSAELKTSFTNAVNGAAWSASPTSITTTGYIMVSATGTSAYIEILINSVWSKVTDTIAGTVGWSGISNGSNVRIGYTSSGSVYSVDKLD